MKILVAGDSSQTYYLIKHLKSRGNSITAICSDKIFCRVLAETFEIEVFYGNESDAEMLKQVYMHKKDLVVAAYEYDADNLVFCEMAKNRYHAKRTCALVHNPKNATFFRSLGVDYCINTLTGKGIELIIEQQLQKDLRDCFPNEYNQIEVHQIKIDDGSPVANKKIWEIIFPQQSMVVCLIRENEFILPQGNTTIRPGDKAVILTSKLTAIETFSVVGGTVLK